jgi:hypothetical protein
MDDITLEAALRELGTRLAFPETPDLTERVVEAAAVAGRPPAPTLRLPRVLTVVAAAAAIVLFLLAVSPRARAIADDLIHLRGVRIERVRRLPPAGTQLHLGGEVTATEARRQVGFPLAVPAQVGPPDAIYVTGASGRRVVSLVYRPRLDLPASSTTGVGLVLSEFRGTNSDPVILKKLLGSGTVLDQTTVGGGPAYWIADQHEVLFVGPSGDIQTDQPRLSGPSMLWERGGITYRLESALGEADAQRLADTVR